MEHPFSRRDHFAFTFPFKACIPGPSLAPDLHELVAPS